jgi:hypothetical protein
MSHVNTGDTITESMFPQWGLTGVTTDGSGQAIISLPTPFASKDFAVIAIPRTGTSQWCTVLVSDPDEFTIELHDSSGPVTSASRTILWIAMGTRP